MTRIGWSLAQKTKQKDAAHMQMLFITSESTVPKFRSFIISSAAEAISHNTTGPKPWKMPLTARLSRSRQLKSPC